MNPLPLADIRPDDIAPLIACVLVFMIPIIAILTKHQQKMALLMRETHPPKANDNEDLRRDVEALRQLVMQQTIAIDNLASRQGTSEGTTAPPPIESRLNG